MATPAGEGSALHCQPYYCEEAANHYTRRGCNLQDTHGQFESEGVPEVPSSHRCLTCLAIRREQGRKTAPFLPLVCFPLLLKPVHLSNVCYTLSSVLKLLQQCVHEALQWQTPFSAPFIPLPYLQVHETWAQLQYCFRCQETMVSNKAHGISAFNDSDSHSSLLKMFLCRLLLRPPMLLIHAINKNKVPCTLRDVVPFQLGTFKYFMSLVWSQVLPFSYSSNRQIGI